MTKSSEQKLRVIYCVSHPIQYFAPFYRQMAKVNDLTFRVVFGTDHGTKPSYDPGFGRVVDFGVDLLFGFDSMFLNRGIRKRNRFFELYVVRWNWIREFKPDIVIISGWRSLMMWQIAFYCFLKKIPVIVRADSTLPPGTVNRTSLKQNLTQPLKSILLRKLRGAFAAGTSGMRYFEAMGMNKNAIYPIPFFVDTNLVKIFAKKGKDKRLLIRQQFGIPENAFLGVALGKLVSKKNPLALVNFLNRAPNETHIAWIGSGALEPVLIEHIRRAGLEERFHLLGFRQPKEAWQIFGAADFFVMPSTHEPWGLSVNEAVAAGLPVLISKVCGCSVDLVRKGQNGYVVDDFTSEDALQKLLLLKEKLSEQRFRKNLVMINADISEKHSIEAARDSMVAVLMKFSQHKRSGMSSALYA